MNLETILNQLGTYAADTAMKAAVAWMNQNRVAIPANPEPLLAAIRVYCKDATSEALADAREAYSIGRADLAVSLYRSTFALAGINAAKEYAANVALMN